MCLILLAYKVHPRFPLILAANRDEFHDRPTLPAAFWPEHPQLLAGKDLRGGGTWLGVTRTGRFAALTNFRDLSKPTIKGPSRGLLVRDVLLGQDLPDTTEFEGFNLLHGTFESLRYHSNLLGTDVELPVGFHGISNYFLDTPWPKVVSAGERFENALGTGDPKVEDLFSLLLDRTTAPDDELPETGVGLEWERKLSSVFIEANGYGTRCSTVIMVNDLGNVFFEERTHVPLGTPPASFNFLRRA